MNDFEAGYLRDMEDTGPDVDDDEAEPDAWELLQELRDDVAKSSYRWGVVYDLGIEKWVCGPLEKRGPELHREKVGTGDTPQNAIRAAWDAVQGGEVAS